jgi:hypothetical protein
MTSMEGTVCLLAKAAGAARKDAVAELLSWQDASDSAGHFIGRDIHAVVNDAGARSGSRSAKLARVLGDEREMPRSVDESARDSRF